MPIFLGWLLGVAIGAVLATSAFVALSLPLPPLLGSLTPLVGTSSFLMVLLLVVLTYLAAYALATRSLTPLLPTVTLPLPAPLPPAGGASVPLPAAFGELIARGVTIGLTAVLNAGILFLIPLNGPLLSSWAFTILSLAVIVPVARSRFYHGFLGWTGWLLPISYIATAVGFLLFVVNAPIAFALGGIGAFRIDWSTGVIETSGGFVGNPSLTGAFTGGFSLGNFNFLTAPGLQDSFLARGLSAHETGHTLNTAAYGGIVLWINAVDENILPVRRNLAYGELTAESHAQALPVAPGAARVDFFVRLWG